MRVDSKEGTQRSGRNFTTSVAATADSDGATLMRSFPNAFFSTVHFFKDGGWNSTIPFIKFICVQISQGQRLHFATESMRAS